MIDASLSGILGNTYGKVKINLEVKLPAHRAELPGNVVMITRSAFLPAPAAGRRGIQTTCP